MKPTHIAVITVSILVILSIAFSRPIKNPAVLAEPDWINAETRELATRACFDCHSNESKRYWYSHLPIAAQLLNQHIKEGREELNFSEWIAGREQEEGNEAAEKVYEPKHYAEHEPAFMPSYAAMHKKAQLSENEKKLLAEGLKQSLVRP